jgi:hypothetical protein
LLSGEGREIAQSYMSMQQMHFRLLCIHYPNQVLDRVKQIKKNEVHFALEQCLEVCQEFKQVEACAIIFHKMVNFFAAATSYMTLLSQKEHFDFPLFIKSLSKYKKILGEKQLFTFIPYQDKDIRLRNKK